MSIFSRLGQRKEKKMEETKAEKGMDIEEILGNLKWEDERPQEERKDIAISFATGHTKEFTGKDGREYVRISIPTEMKMDTGKSWPSFVLPADQVKMNESGKSMWAKIPKDGKTTLSMSEQVGTKEDGTKEYKTQYVKIDNQELKKIMEASRERSTERVSFREQLNGKKAEIAPPKPGEDIPFKDHIL